MFRFFFLFPPKMCSQRGGDDNILISSALKLHFPHIFPYFYCEVTGCAQKYSLGKQNQNFVLFPPFLLFSFNSHWAFMLNIQNCGDTVLPRTNVPPSHECPIYAFPYRQVIIFIWNVLLHPAPPKFLCHFHHCSIITYSISKWSKQHLLFPFPFLSPERNLLNYIF